MLDSLNATNVPRSLGVVVSHTYVTTGASTNPILAPMKTEEMYRMCTLTALYNRIPATIVDTFMSISPCFRPMYLCRNPPTRQPNGRENDERPAKCESNQI